MCTVLKVSETGYYKYRRNKGKPSKNEFLLAEMKKIRNESMFNKNYGVPRMQTALVQRGIRAGRRRIVRIMTEQGWLHKKRRCRSLTKADTPLTKLLTDITQISCMNGTLYISPILDCYNQEVLALNMDNNMRAELCVKTFQNAADRYKLKGAILHSDRGSQYTSHAYRYALSKEGVTQSLSGTGKCFDNAKMGSFFATLKKELLYQIPTTRMTTEAVKKEIFRYVFIYYNRIRIHTSKSL